MKSLSFAISVGILLAAPTTVSAAQPGARVAINDISATFIHADQSRSAAVGIDEWSIWNSIQRYFGDGEIWVHLSTPTYGFMTRDVILGYPPRVADVTSLGYVLNDPMAGNLGVISANAMTDFYTGTIVTTTAFNEFILQPGATLNIQGRIIFDNWIVGAVGDSWRDVSGGIDTVDDKSGSSPDYAGLVFNDFGHYEQWLDYRHTNTGTTAESVAVSMSVSLWIDGGREASPVPEAGAGYLSAAGLSALAFMRRLRRRASAGAGTGRLS